MSRSRATDLALNLLLPGEDAGRLRNALGSPDDHERAFAGWELGEMGAPASEEAPFVAPLLADPIAGVRSAAAEGALPALVPARRDPNDGVRAAAAAVVDRLTGR